MRNIPSSDNATLADLLGTLSHIVCQSLAIESQKSIQRLIDVTRL